MTANSHSRSSVIRVEEIPATHAEPALAAKRQEWVRWTIGLCSIIIFYLVLLNPYWAPSGDGDLYLAIARSIALGEGFRFNGQQVNICPPGWPLLLAGLMKISPTFVLFKLVLILCQAIQLGMWYWLLRRIVERPVAIAAVLLSAILIHVYSLTFWTHSEAVYCVVSTASLLLAMHLAEGRGGWAWRIPALLALCVACVFIRWAGVLQIVLLGGALLNGRKFWEFKDRHNQALWATALACGIVLVATMSALREHLKLTRAQEIAAAEAGAVFEETQMPPQASVESQTLRLVNVSAPRDATVAEELWRRFTEAGRWVSWLCWQPFRFTAAISKIAWIDIFVGWIAIATLLVSLGIGISRFHWLWIGAAVYCGALMINWPNANARYLVPIAPLMIAGILTGIYAFFGQVTIRLKWEQVILILLAALALLLTLITTFTQYKFSPWPLWALAVVGAVRLWVRRGPSQRWIAASKVWGAAFVISVCAVNLVLYAIDVQVARSSRFYQRYEAGFHGELISVCSYLNDESLQDGQLAVSERYQNLGRVRKSKYAVRAANLLTNRVVLTVKDKDAGAPPRPVLLRWLQQRKSVKYYLDQRPSVPWRVWHFVLPRWLNEKLTPAELGPDSGGWKLYRPVYERVPSTQPASQPGDEPAWEYRRSATLIDVPQKRNWPTRVPGM